jgi:hypothetical protein
VGLSSFRYTGSIVWATATGTVLTSLGAVLQGVLEVHAERRRALKGITLTDVPVRPKLVLEMRAAPERLIALCREAWGRPEFRIKHVEIDEPLRLVARTKLSFYSFSERITVQAEAGERGLAVLQISSVPWLTTTQVDGGVNYTNLFMLSRYVKERVPTDAVASETLSDTALEPQR